MSYHTKEKTYTTERLYRYFIAITLGYTRIAESYVCTVHTFDGDTMFKLSELFERLKILFTLLFNFQTSHISFIFFYKGVVFIYNRIAMNIVTPSFSYINSEAH